ncbi:MAG TPA: hypothetical protein ENK57_10500, partial [Polyangiaceae bacterium]|nr:hypothetical protein [Polyangiaceae bacterium]
MKHLNEIALEALATGRDDLVDPAALAHLDECADCAQRVSVERLAAQDATVALERMIPALDDLDAMVMQAMQAAPETEIALGAAPTPRSLVTAAGLGGLAAVGLGLLSLPGGDSVSALSAA